MNTTSTSRVMWPHSLVAALATILLFAGCGDTKHHLAVVPHTLPSGSIAVVSQFPITREDLARWQPVLTAAKHPQPRARRRTLSYLIESQWVLREAEDEGINMAVLDKLVARQLASDRSSSGDATRAQRSFQARVDFAAAALRHRHGHVDQPIAPHEISRYYEAHHSDFFEPAARRVQVIVTHSFGAARQARIALERGKPWATVVKHFSVNPAAPGAAIDIPSDGGPHQLVRAAFATPNGGSAGPLRIAGRSGDKQLFNYYVLKVIGDHPAGPQPLAEVAAQIRNRLRERRSVAALAAFERAFMRHWRVRTLCAPAYRVAACRNYKAKK